MKTHIYIQPTPEATAAAFADFLEKWILKKEPFNLALSGGSTPKILFHLLAEKFRERIPWERVHIFWGDERCVPPGDPQSNYKMTSETLLQHVPIPPVNIHRIRGEEPPQKEALRYAAEIQQFVPEKNGWPSFDLVLLGIGADGHTASIFPNQKTLLEAKQICAPAIHPESGQHRISLTGQVIANSRKVAFLVTGHSKRKVVQAILEKSEESKAYPAAHIRAKKDLYWFLDEEAAKREF